VTHPVVHVCVWSQKTRKKRTCEKGKKIKGVTFIHLEASLYSCLFFFHCGTASTSLMALRSQRRGRAPALPPHSLPVVVKLRLSTRLRLILSLPVWLLRILPQRRRGCARPRGGWANLVGRPSSAARGRPLLPRFWPVSPHFFPVLKLMDPLPPIRAAAQPCAFSC